jgi:hypothetical protein
MLGEGEGVNPSLNGFREIYKACLILVANPMGTHGWGGAADKGWALNEGGHALHVSSPHVHADGHVGRTSMKQHFRHITYAKQ